MTSLIDTVTATPAKAGAAIGAVTGVIVWALMAYVPAFHDGVPLAITTVIPVAVAWAGHVIGTHYMTAPASKLPANPTPPAGQ